MPIFILKSLINTLFRYSYGSSVNYHRGTKNTIQGISKRFWWDSLKSDVSGKMIPCIHGSLERLVIPGHQGVM